MTKKQKIIKVLAIGFAISIIMTILSIIISIFSGISSIFIEENDEKISSKKE